MRGFSIVLSAGVSMSQGATSWKRLLEDFKQDISDNGWLDDSPWQLEMFDKCMMLLMVMPQIIPQMVQFQ